MAGQKLILLLALTGLILGSSVSADGSEDRSSVSTGGSADGSSLSAGSLVEKFKSYVNWINSSLGGGEEQGENEQDKYGKYSIFPNVPLTPEQVSKEYASLGKENLLNPDRCNPSSGETHCNTCCHPQDGNFNPTWNTCYCQIATTEYDSEESEDLGLMTDPKVLEFANNLENSVKKSKKNRVRNSE